MDGAIEPPWTGLRRVLHGHALRLPGMSGRRCLGFGFGSCLKKRAGGPQARQRQNSPRHDVLLQLIQLAPLRIDHRLHQVTDGNHPQYLPALDHRQMADAVIGHQLQAVFHLLTGTHRHYFRGHDFRHGGVTRRTIVEHDLACVIALGDVYKRQSVTW